MPGLIHGLHPAARCFPSKLFISHRSLNRPKGILIRCYSVVLIITQVLLRGNYFLYVYLSTKISYLFLREDLTMCLWLACYNLNQTVLTTKQNESFYLYFLNAGITDVQITAGFLQQLFCSVFLR